MNQPNAILIFARSILAESVAKPLHPNKETNLKLHKALYVNTLEVVKETKLPYYVINEKDQQGVNFGDKITNAVAQIFNKGYNSVTIIGTDCANITTKQLLQANVCLQNNNNCIGGDIHGGAYLIGILKNNFNAQSFESLNWCTANFFDSLAKYFTTFNALTTEFNLKTDVNSSFDLRMLVRYSCTKFIKYLASFFNKNFNIFYFCNCFYSFRYYLNYNHRGPPKF